jgi:hypothetical protein
MRIRFQYMFESHIFQYMSRIYISALQYAGFAVDAMIDFTLHVDEGAIQAFTQLQEIVGPKHGALV